jgi:hypothetical protein
MERQLSKINQNHVINGANIIATLTLAGLAYKNFLEINKKFDEIQQELDTIKSSFNENNKRANIAFTRLNQKIEDTNRVTKNQGNFLEDLKRRGTIQESSKINDYEEDAELSLNNKDDVSSALELLMKK